MSEKKMSAAEMGAMGGKARAKSMTPEQRSEQARRAVEARWEKATIKAEHKATHTGDLKIGDLIIPCAVLEDGTRVLTQEGFLKAIGRSGKPAAGRGSQVEKMAPFLDLDNLKPFVDMELADSTKPIVFQAPTGSRAYGYKAELLPQVCEVYLRARDARALLKSQDKMAKACEILMRALAHVGIVALVDEATGFQDARARDALAKILEQFVAKELRRWVRTFPLDYFKELCRLRKVPFSPMMRLPSYFGHLTNDLVYSRLAPGILAELRKKNPVENGRRKNKHFQWLTDDVGDPRLREHLWAVTSLMKAFDDWDAFHRAIDRSLPRQIQYETPLFDAAKEDAVILLDANGPLPQLSQSPSAS